ncbi:MAG: hypothetical protein Q9162_000467 [Coniocarpon cinnabarinum]
MELWPRGHDPVAAAPPSLRTRLENHATLLVSWWCTGCALVLILLRLWGRAIRTERLFTEDKIMALSIVPLLIRMALVDPILLYGTNNTDPYGLDPIAIREREKGSKLVLASRIFYAMLYVPLMFRDSTQCGVAMERRFRLTCNIWTRRYELQLMGIRIFLFVTFFAVVIATLAECQPFHHYWQVTPDPGSQCRSGYAQLLVMSCCDIVTDILLVVFPIPIIVRSAMRASRKAAITFLFSLSILLIIITSYRLSAILHQHGRQQLRSLWASLEILASAAVSNTLILGSFVRDRGVKKAKYKGPESVVDRSFSEAPNDPQTNLVRTMTRKHWGEDEDEELFKHCRGRLGSIEEDGALNTPAAVAARPAFPHHSAHGAISPNTPTFGNRPRKFSSATAVSHGIGEVDMSPTLFDVGGILDDDKQSFSKPSSSHDGSMQGLDPGKSRKPPTSDPPTSPRSGTNAFDFADIGGLLNKKPQHAEPPQASAGAEEEKPQERNSRRRMSNFSFPFSPTSPAARKAPSDDLRNDPPSTELQDIGGLLGDARPPSPPSPRSKPMPPPKDPLPTAFSTGQSSRPPRDYQRSNPDETIYSLPPHPEHPDDDIASQSSTTNSLPPSRKSSPSRKPRSRPSSLFRATLQNSFRASSQQPSQPRNSSSQRHTRSRSRSRVDPATAALGLIAQDQRRSSPVPHRDSSAPRSHGPTSIPRSNLADSSMGSSADHPLASGAGTGSGFEGELPPELRKRDSQNSDIDTKAHARDWLGKIKAARERQNESHGTTRMEARGRGGESFDAEDEGGLRDVGGLLDVRDEELR